MRLIAELNVSSDQFRPGFRADLDVWCVREIPVLQHSFQSND